MPILDGFVQAMFEFRADGLVLQAGEPACLMTGIDRKPITNQTPTMDQLFSILKEIAPPEALKRLMANRHDSFEYQSPSGAVRVNAFGENNTLRLHILPVGGKPADIEEILMGAEVVETPRRPMATPMGRVSPVRVAVPAEKAAEMRAAAMAPAPARSSAAASSGAAAAAAATQAPVTNVTPRARAPELEALFLTMIRERCSDLHLCSGNTPMFRKDGDIVSLGDLSALPAARVASMIDAILPPRLREKFESSHDIDFAYEIPGAARFRCNLFFDRKGPGGVFRIIPTDIVSAEALGVSKAILEFCEASKGLVLVTGPTGSGKSTTLASMIDYVNRKKTGHIITIEDPIEFVHENKKCLVNQREIGPHTDGFKAALRAALREDPDIVLVGELRDLETVAIAIETAETGHLVFGTLHTNTAASTVDRMIDQFPMGQQAQIRTMLSESLKGVVSQTLLKKKGGGRVAAHEVLVVTPSIANLIREGKTFQITSIMQTGKGVGMTTMNDALLDLVKRKIVEPEEALAKAIARNEFKAALVKLGINVSEN